MNCCCIDDGGKSMRTPSQRQADRKEIMEGVSDSDVTVCEAILELCRTIDDASERTVAAHEGLRETIAQLDADLKQAVR
jgi:hypothetical protein